MAKSLTSHFDWGANGNDMEIEAQYLRWTTARHPLVSYLPSSLGMNLTLVHQSCPLPGFVRYDSGAAEVEWCHWVPGGSQDGTQRMPRLLSPCCNISKKQRRKRGERKKDRTWVRVRERRVMKLGGLEWRLSPFSYCYHQQHGERGGEQTVMITFH